MLLKVRTGYLILLQVTTGYMLGQVRAGLG